MILQRYILRELLLSFVFTFVVIMAVCLLGTTFQIFRAYQGLGFELLPRMTPFAAGYVAPWALLVASCTSATLVYGRLAADNEIDAMRMSGIHANRILTPAILFGLLLSGVMYGFAEHATPAAGDGRRKLVKESMDLLLKLPPPGSQQFKIGPYLLSYLNYRNGRMEKIDLMKWDKDDRLEAEYSASSGRPEITEGGPPQIVMSKPSYAVLYRADGTVQRLSAQSDIQIPLEFEDAIKKDKKPDYLSREQLDELLKRTSDPTDRARIVTTMHTRRAQTFAPLLLVIVSVPIGIFVKKGSRLAGLGAALPPLVVYFVIFFIFQGLGDKGRISPLLAAGLPDGALAALSAVLLAGVYRK